MKSRIRIIITTIVVATIGQYTLMLTSAVLEHHEQQARSIRIGRRRDDSLEDLISDMQNS